jgi:hypothetical protein
LAPVLDPFAIDRLDHPFSKRFSRQSKVYAMRGHRARVPGTSDSPIPLGWTQESRDASLRSVYRYGHIQFNPFHGEYRRYSYRCRRDAIHLHTPTRHEYRIPRAHDNVFPPGFRSTNTHDLDQEQIKLQQMLGQFAAECNVSSRAIASGSMLHFTHCILDMGLTLGRASPIITPELLMLSISAKEVSEMIQSSGEARAREILSRYQGRRFMNLVCDTGTVQTLHVLYPLVTSPYCTLPSLLANLVDRRGFSGADYAQFFEATIAAQFENGFVVCGVIIDNLAAQRLWLRQTLAFSENAAVRTVSHIPCFYHTINLVFVHSMNNCSKLHTVMATLGGCVPDSPCFIRRMEGSSWRHHFPRELCDRSQKVGALLLS